MKFPPYAAVAIAHVFAVPAQCQTHHCCVSFQLVLFLASQVCTSYVGLCLMSMLNETQFNSIMAADITIFFIRSKAFHQKVASQCVAPLSIARMQCLHQGALGFSRLIMIFTWFTLFALPMGRRTTNSFGDMASSSLVRSRAIAVLFP